MGALLQPLVNAAVANPSYRLHLPCADRLARDGGRLAGGVPVEVLQRLESARGDRGNLP